jgi:hypothetical protein
MTTDLVFVDACALTELLQAGFCKHVAAHNDSSSQQQLPADQLHARAGWLQVPPDR